MALLLRHLLLLIQYHVCRSLSRVLKNMKAKTFGSLEPKSRKIYLYAGHENNVANVLAALNLLKPHVPEYCAALMIELHQTKKEETYFVKIYYAKDPFTEPELLVLEGCAESCPLRSFISITLQHIPVNYTAECNSSKPLG